MGYNTQYSLSVTTGNEYTISQLREECDEASWAIDDNGNCREECKWDDHDKDMKMFSKKYPEVLFCMDGEGEESGDIWRTYYKNGKSQEIRAKIVYEEYDENKLK